MNVNLRFLFGVAAALAFFLAGYDMLNLHSTSGNTVAELFDQYMGVFSIGLGFLTLALTAPRLAPAEAPASGPAWAVPPAGQPGSPQ